MSQPAAAADQSQDATVTADRSTSPVRWLGWAVFLASSWTWCIGMFLPVLLVRDFGFWGWVVFAVPNVVGAAAMGWVVRDAQSSRELINTHRIACQMFSAVTIAFHFFFVVAVVGPLASSITSQGMDLALGCVLAGAILMYILMTHQHGSGRVLALLALLVSLAAMVLAIIDIGRTPEELPSVWTPFKLQLLWLAPVCVFGFVGCPYLDLTFHRARQETPSPRASFGVGFGVFFLLMIVFTLIYSHAINEPMSIVLGTVLFAHMLVQCAFTIAAHARELRYHSVLAAIVAAVLTLSAWAAYWFLSRGAVVERMRSGELVYRVFMGFYGLIFPAYVWLVVLPTRGRAPSFRNLFVFALAVLMALPMFWQGFVVGEMIWLVPGLALVGFAKLLVIPRAGYATANAL